MLGPTTLNVNTKLGTILHDRNYIELLPYYLLCLLHQAFSPDTEEPASERSFLLFITDLTDSFININSQVCMVVAQGDIGIPIQLTQNYKLHRLQEIEAKTRHAITVPEGKEIGYASTLPLHRE